MPETPYTETHWARFLSEYVRIRDTLRIAATMISVARELNYADHDRWAATFVQATLEVAINICRSAADLVEDIVPEGDRELPF